MEDTNLAETAYRSLFPDSTFNYTFIVTYSGRLKDYGAYVSMKGTLLEFKMSCLWYQISPEIQMGLMQELILKLFKRKKSSMYIDLYNSFVKNLHIAVPKDDVDPELQQCFDRVNERYFLGLVEMPNLVWGKFATTTFGSYDFKCDRITISRVFKEIDDQQYIDYIMFHEMLHKQRKFFKSGARTYYHDKKFKRLEKVFEQGPQIEKDLSRVVARAKATAAYRDRTVKKKDDSISRQKTTMGRLFGWL
ncbi:MAG: SprT-like domain-containing protein [Candidatus Woesearchaeota archaeon]